MDDAEIDDRLRAAPTGVLALAAGDDAYAVPLAHYYDGDRLYFRLGRGGGGEKWAHIERTDEACYVVHGVEETPAPEGLDSWSVTVSGRLSELPTDETARFDTAEINRRFSPIRVFDEAIEAIEIVILELEIESLTGRTTLS